MSAESNQLPTPTTHELYGDTAVYQPSVNEHDFNGIPVHAPRDIHEDLVQGGDPAARQRDEALEGEEDK
jgi:hypothetical protein